MKRWVELVKEGAAVGLAVRGAFHPAPGDGIEGGTLVLLGWTGERQWSHFAASPEYADGGRDPLDRWSRRVAGTLAARFGARALFPFGGPPYWPFQRWAIRCEPVFPSPIGLAIHAEYGLWHSYRAALVFDETLAIPEPTDAGAASPCARCVERPCLGTCPVGAFRTGHYDVAACVAHIAGEEGRDCRESGCLARRACPVAQGDAYGPKQASFFMEAFLAARLANAS